MIDPVTTAFVAALALILAGQRDLARWEHALLAVICVVSFVRVLVGLGSVVP